MITFNRIAAVGLELEGGWNKDRNDLVPDAGIKINGFKNSVVCGELVSKPIDNYEDCVKFLKDNYPTETNDMSGYHIHLSFKRLESYTALMCKGFQKYFIEYLTKFGETYPIQNNYFWNRIEDKNRFCRNRFDPDQIFLKKKIENDPGRYTALHYSFGLHGTIESRVLPTFVSVDTAIAALEATILAFESYLELNPPKPFKFDREESVEEDATTEKAFEENFVTEAKPVRKAKPFNLFMARGLVPEAKYGMKELYKQDRRVEKKSVRKAMLNGEAMNNYVNVFADMPVYKYEPDNLKETQF